MTPYHVSTRSIHLYRMLHGAFCCEPIMVARSIHTQGLMKQLRVPPVPLRCLSIVSLIDHDARVLMLLSATEFKLKLGHARVRRPVYRSIATIREPRNDNIRDAR